MHNCTYIHRIYNSFMRGMFHPRHCTIHDPHKYVVDLFGESEKPKVKKAFLMCKILNFPSVLESFLCVAVARNREEWSEQRGWGTESEKAKSKRVSLVLLLLFVWRSLATTSICFYWRVKAKTSRNSDKRGKSNFRFSFFLIEKCDFETWLTSLKTLLGKLFSFASLHSLFAAWAPFFVFSVLFFYLVL